MTDKDHFKVYYSNALARRLLMSLMNSVDLEKRMLALFKDVCGHDYTYHMNRMFDDMENSKHSLGSVKQSLGKFPFEFDPVVVYSGNWPMSTNQAAVVFPLPLQQPLSLYENAFMKEFTNKKLLWMPTYSKGEMKATYWAKGQERSYVFVLSACQMAIILALSDEEPRSLESISGNVGDFSQHAVKEACKVLLEGQVLLTENNYIALNHQFYSKTLKIDFNHPTEEESRKVQEDVYKSTVHDRQMHIQAAIVRVMKHKNNLKQSILTAEVIQTVCHYFQPDVGDIKKAIEVLIEKDYLKTDELDKDSVRYVA